MFCPKIKKEFWIVNTSNRNVRLSDLDLTIPPYASINLLSKNCRLTEAQINDSVNAGSVKRSSAITVRKVAPGKEMPYQIPQSLEPMPSKSKSAYEIKMENYQELSLDDDSDEKFAMENADMAENDTKPFRG